MQVFQDDVLLRQCLEVGFEICPSDKRPFSASYLRSMLMTFRNTKRVSNFRPTVARSVFERYTAEGDTILDPAAGFGGRLLGALPLKRRYIGIDPSSMSIAGMRKLVKAVADNTFCQADVELMESAAEDALRSFSSSSVDLAIFSPPYFRRERYEESANQSWTRYASYPDWLVGFLESVLRQITRTLRPGGKLVFNAANTESHPVFSDARVILASLLRPYYSYRMLIGNVPFHRNGNRGGFRWESLVVYEKPIGR